MLGGLKLDFKAAAGMIIGVLMVGFTGWLTFMASSVSTNNALLTVQGQRLVKIETKLELLRVPEPEVMHRLDVHQEQIRDHESRLRAVENQRVEVMRPADAN